MVYADELDVDKDFGWPVREMKKRGGTPKNSEVLKIRRQRFKYRRQREWDLMRKKEMRRLRIRKVVNLGVSVSGI